MSTTTRKMKLLDKKYKELESIITDEDVLMLIHEIVELELEIEEDCNL